MTKEYSNRNQTTAAEVYRFGEWELHPQERLLKRAGQTAALAPKAFDALLCLVRRAGRLVTKAELNATLWPSTHVSEASLTNIIVNLRKTLGHEAISTVSKHGYRLELTVEGEPGISRELYARFVRARELATQRASTESAEEACTLCWTCLAENPNFALGWAWLGRVAYFLAKFGKREKAYLDLAQASFRRAFTLEPDLASAHQFYTPMEADTGYAHQAMERLLERVARQVCEPETYAGLVQVFRYRGLLEESVGADERARELDPSLMTSVSHTFFLTGDFAASIDNYTRRGGAYLDAAAWAALGEIRRARELLRERIARMAFSGVMLPLIQSLLAILEERAEDAVRIMDAAAIRHEPEVRVYFARHYARAGAVDRGIASLRQALREGFVPAPSTLKSDGWLAPVRQHPEFGTLERETASRVREAQRVLTAKGWGQARSGSSSVT